MQDKLKLECLQRRAYVSLERLQTKDLMKLRQPKVVLKRIKSWSNLSKGSKSRTVSSSSSNVSGVQRLKRKLSNALSLNEELHLKRGRGDSTDSSSNSPLLSSRRKNLMVTPRSASGLKLRISSVGQECGEQILSTSSASSTPPHSSSKLPYNRLKRKKAMPQLMELSDNDFNTEDEEELIVVDDADFIPEDSRKHPLYEEEIII